MAGIVNGNRHEDEVRYESARGVATITFDRQSNRNASRPKPMPNRLAADVATQLVIAAMQLAGEHDQGYRSCGSAA